jgi:hypothetical protein
MKFLIGCDPELMLVDTGGNLKSAIPVCDGSKHEPQKVKGGAVLSDNVNLEFNTEPAKNSAEFVKSIKTVLLESHKIVAKHGLKLVVRASADFPKAELKDPRALEFGCEPDYDAWALRMNEVEQGAAEKGFRSCGGHIHIGVNGKETEFLNEDMGKIRMIKTMDALLGIISVIIDTDPTSPARRKLYGKAGCHRPKPYGVEYRAIGNFWVNSPALVELIYSLTEKAVEIASNNQQDALIDAIGEDKIVDIINESKVKDAKKVYDKHLKPLLNAELVTAIENAIKTKDDFYQSWGM